GSTDTAATCAAVTASTTLSCTYTVVSGDTTSHLDYQSTSALTGTIADAAGNSATLTLPALQSSALYTGQTIIIDTTAPSAPTGVALTTATDTGTSTSDGTTNVTSVSVTGTAEAGSTVALLDAGVAISGATGTATNGTFTIATTLAAGSHTITATATDTAGNTGSASSSLAVTVDQTAPTVTSIVRASSAAVLTNASPVFTVTFSENVTGVVAANFTASKGTGISGTESVSVSGSGTTWTVTVSGLTGDYGTNSNATVGLTVVPLTSATVSGTNESYNLDTTTPTYAITYSRTAPLNAGAVTVTVTANETLSAAPTISINQPGTTDISSASTSGSGPYTYAYTVVAANAGTYVDGTATVTVSGSDLAGNTGTTITSGGTFAIDTTAPSVALTYSIGASAYSDSVSRPVKTGDTVTIKATMTEVVALSAAPTITLTATGGVTTVTATPMTQVGSSLVYTYAYAVQASEDGTVSASVSATDTAGNALASAAVTAFTVDNTAPAVVLAYTDTGSANVTGPYKSGDRVTVTATFTEANAISGTPTLSLVAGTYTGGTLPTVTLALSSGTTYTGTFTIPAGNGAVTATVSATDTAGNTLSASGQTGFTIDNTAPTYAITYSRTAPLNAGAVTVTVT
ncbi:MAG: hypothetical protein EBS94_16955, partial [Proteobacteria bacterium]|nr:hypothetical protein [Pseudomonadota bacterium]